MKYIYGTVPTDAELLAAPTLSDCCDAEITETGFCAQCWEHA